MADRALLARAREDLGAFGRMVGRPMTSWQLDALQLQSRVTTIVSPRQLGKSRSLATLAVWYGFTRPGAVVLVVSAGEDAALRLLREVREVVTGSELLAGSVIDERAALVRLTNQSEIRSVPASERAIRGQRVQLLLIDEATQVGEDLLVSAALPTVAAQADGRVVLASSPIGAEGPFYRFAMAGEAGDPDVATFRWRRADAPWINRSLVEAARRSMSAQRFASEFEGEFAVGDGDFLDLSQVQRMSSEPGPVDDVVIGLDPGQVDAFAFAVVGAATDPPARLAVAEVGTLDAHNFTAAVDEVARIAERFGARVVTDQHGSAMLAERLRSRGVSVRVTPWAGSSGPAAVGVWDGYSELRRRLVEGTLQLLDDAPLLRELASLQVKASGTAWRVVSPRRAGSHGDRASALALAVAACHEPQGRLGWLSDRERAARALAEVVARAERAQRARAMWDGEPPPGWTGGGFMSGVMTERF